MTFNASSLTSRRAATKEAAAAERPMSTAPGLALHLVQVTDAVTRSGATVSPLARVQADRSAEIVAAAIETARNGETPAERAPMARLAPADARRMTAADLHKLATYGAGKLARMMGGKLDPAEQEDAASSIRLAILARATPDAGALRRYAAMPYGTPRADARAALALSRLMETALPLWATLAPADYRHTAADTGTATYFHQWRGFAFNEARNLARARRAILAHEEGADYTVSEEGAEPTRAQRAAMRAASGYLLAEAEGETMRPTVEDLQAAAIRLGDSFGKAEVTAMTLALGTRNRKQLAEDLGTTPGYVSTLCERGRANLRKRGAALAADVELSGDEALTLYVAQLTHEATAQDRYLRTYATPHLRPTAAMIAGNPHAEHGVSMGDVALSMGDDRKRSNATKLPAWPDRSAWPAGTRNGKDKSGDDADYVIPSAIVGAGIRPAIGRHGGTAPAPRRPRTARAYLPAPRADIAPRYGCATAPGQARRPAPIPHYGSEQRPSIAATVIATVGTPTKGGITYTARAAKARADRLAREAL